MADAKRRNPWKGLNYYTEGEILYGRNVEILSLSQYIFNNTQTILFGRSGIGKSSILNAGIFPKARQNGMTPISIRLKHSDANDYLAQIKEAISLGGLIAKELTPAINGEENETLWEYMHRHTFFNENGKQCIPLLVFDQFEEIFTLQTNEQIKRDFFQQLGNLLNDVKPSYVVEHESQHRQQLDLTKETKTVSSGAFKGINIKLNVRKSEATQTNANKYLERPEYHIVFALREDFLSSLELYVASIPVMKDNRFGLLPLNEEQAADIIRLPQPGLVDDDVTKLIIEQVTGRTDFILDGIPEIEVDAAVLSLYLSRLYIKKSDSEQCITAELVKSSSGHIIHDFYVEAITSDTENGEILTEKTIEILEDYLLTGEGRRNNVSRSDLIALGVKESELQILINNRKLLRQFHHGNDIRIEYIHDILCPVVKERRLQRDLLKQQELEHERQEHEKKLIIAEAEAHAKRIRNRNKKIFIWASSIAFVLIVAGVYYWHEKMYLPNKLYEKYYADFELVNGWPKGINELSEIERSQMPLYYKLSHVGENTHDTDIEVMSSNSMLPSTERIKNWPEVCVNNNDIAGTAFNDILCKIKRIHFTPDETYNKVSQMEFKDAQDNLLMLFSYFHVNEREAWMNYTYPNGHSMSIRDNGIDRVKMSWDSIGRIEYQRYYTSSGVAKNIHADNKIAGFYHKYSENNPNEVDCIYLNIYGLPNTENSYNLKSIVSKGDTLITTYFYVNSFDDVCPKEVVGEHGYSRIETIGSKENLYIPGNNKFVATSITDFDHYGNPIKQTISGSVNDSLPPVILWEYKGKTGLLSKKTYLSQDSKQPFGKSDDIYKWEMEYDKEGNKISEQHFNTTQKLVYSHSKRKIEKDGVTIIKDILNDMRNNTYLTKVDTIFENKISTSFYNNEGQRINKKVPFWAEDSVVCHNWTIETKGPTQTSKHYYVDDNGNVLPVSTNIDPKTYRATSFMITKIFDDNGNVEKVETRDVYGNVIKRMMYYIQNGEIIGRAAWGIDNTPVRCPEWEEEGFGYFKMYYSKDFDNTYVYLQTFDEWMNNSVFQIGVSYMKVLPLDLKGRFISSSDNSFTGKVKINHAFSLPMFTTDKSISNVAMPYLHILSKESPLYNIGLKDGDRIIRIGSWKFGDASTKLLNEWTKLKNSNNEVGISILRPTRNGYAELTKKFKNDTDSELYAEYHFMNLSNDEKSFYENRTQN